jgi:hypothetical protein
LICCSLSRKVEGICFIRCLMLSRGLSRLVSLDGVHR